MCHLHEDQAQGTLDRADVEKTTTSGATHKEIGLQRNGTSSSLATNLDPISAVMTIVFVRGEHINPAFVLQLHTAPTAGVMVWGVIAYNARSPLVLIHGTMTSQLYVHDNPTISFNILIMLLYLCSINTVGFRPAFLPCVASRKDENGVLGIPLAHALLYTEGRSDPTPVNRLVVHLFGLPEETLL
ncbi:transposable element Tcb2 transposase [Trichonephila clavipes]|nr:transposable element Tcb2 transposase [Trichonephila clavipes]